MESNEIEHWTTKVGNPRTNGFVERFNRTVLDELFRTAFRKNFSNRRMLSKEDLDDCLQRYNHEGPLGTISTWNTTP